MCLILVAKDIHPEYKLLIAANRDEYHNRPSLPLHWWQNNNILSGIDEQAGGAWFGTNKKGGIAALTNYRDLTLIDENKVSRGHLIGQYLINSPDIDIFSHYIQTSASEYNPYNVMFGTVDSLYHYSNISNIVKPIKSGIYGLSNHLFDTPWPKVVLGKKKLHQYCEEGIMDIEPLFAILKNKTQANVSELPNTGIGLELEKILSPMFIQTERYGTKCSSIIQVTHSNEILFSERTYAPDGQQQNTITHKFSTI